MATLRSGSEPASSFNMYANLLDAVAIGGAYDGSACSFSSRSTARARLAVGLYSDGLAAKAAALAIHAEGRGRSIMCRV